MEDLTVELLDGFWAPRQAQLRDHTLAVLLQRLEAHGVVDNFRRLHDPSPSAVGHRGLWFTDSDLYKWMEAAALAGRLDLLDPVADAVLAAQQPDGYLHSFYGTHAGGADQPRYGDLGLSHEQYCAGHFIEAALAHEEATGDARLLDAARRLADHLCTTFGPGADTRVDKHPEVELAMARLAARTGEPRFLDFARWVVEAQLADAGLTVASVDLAGHAVRALYLASGIAEVALATGESEWVHAAERLFDTLVTERSYPTGAVGGRWLGEAVGRPFELPEATAYAESCAAVAATQFCRRMWRLTHDLRALEQQELLLFNAVPCGVGDTGDTWFYSQPQAVAEEAATAGAESNPWIEPFAYGELMLLEWFPPRRHEWFDVTCCPPNLARLFASAHRHVAEVALGGEWHGDLLVHLPVAARISGAGWHVEVASDYPAGGDVTVRVHEAPPGRSVRVRRPLWADPGAGVGAGGLLEGGGHIPLTDGGSMALPCEPTWWETDPRVEGAPGTVFLRRGPVVHCVEGVDVPGLDLRRLTVDPTAAPASTFAWTDPGGADLHHPVRPGSEAVPVDVPTVPYHAWANRGPTSMRLRFPRR